MFCYTPFPKENADAPQPTMAGVFGLALITLGLITTLLKLSWSFFVVTPAMTDINNLGSWDRKWGADRPASSSFIVTVPSCFKFPFTSSCQVSMTPENKCGFTDKNITSQDRMISEFTCVVDAFSCRQWTRFVSDGALAKTYKFVRKKYCLINSIYDIFISFVYP